MGTNTSLVDLFAFATIISSSLASPNFDFEHLNPDRNYELKHHSIVSDWKDNAFNQSPDYTLQDENIIRIQTILEFTKKLIGNSIDIDPEFVKIVDENFWDLI
ncbi:MAG: hypothetical protein CVV22_11055 [Ignavibacteriae bacterium HGW-Ignavibacteriae-1]|jgi:hypothetical protein|nr:MAG: hypothetical protein CVV22_11055 [Ignavibacteriae bacterium HGW-Ignavibacteriae-1]